MISTMYSDNGDTVISQIYAAIFQAQASIDYTHNVINNTQLSNFRIYLSNLYAVAILSTVTTSGGQRD